MHAGNIQTKYWWSVPVFNESGDDVAYIFVEEHYLHNANSAAQRLMRAPFVRTGEPKRATPEEADQARADQRKRQLAQS